MMAPFLALDKGTTSSCGAAARFTKASATWKAYDREAAQASEKISEQVQSRYGTDVNNTDAYEASVSAALRWPVIRR